jgi:hypothetical protein
VNPFTWEHVDWGSLDRLRQGFLGAGGPAPGYWKSLDDLANYNLTYGERIGWKWDAVLAELRLRGWSPEGGVLLDWGCGSGVAGRRVVRAFGPERFPSFRVWDHAPLACNFATQAAAAEFPAMARPETAAPAFLRSKEPIGLLVISHVLNELDSRACASLRHLALRSAAILWVEPGSKEVSRALGGWRDDLAAAFHVIAPCTHQNPCPILKPVNERHWCHHFAPPPAGIFVDANWMRFGRRAGIDLRSLPYAFLALERKDRYRGGSPPGLSRVIGRTESFKPYVRFLNCDAAGLEVLTLQKRDAPALCKELDRTRDPLVYRWRRDGSTIRGSEPLG